jgi:hypothetical protein
MQQSNRQTALPGVFALFSHTAKQARPTRDRFVMLAGFDQAAV